VIPTSIWVILHAEWLMTFYLGNQYQGAGIILQFLFVAVVFRTLNRVSDALLRAIDATFAASWIKAFYVVMMIAACLIGALWGIQWVALGIAISTAVHFVMGAWKGQQLIGGSLAQLLLTTWNGWRIGFIVLVDTILVKWFLFDGESSLLEVSVTLVMVLLTYIVILLKMPDWMGSPMMNPIQYLPSKLRNKIKY
jgi:O-antigen/teichoic acid export membrane protein